MKALDQGVHVAGGPSIHWKKDAAAENQHPGDLAAYIPALRHIDDAADFDVVDAFGSTTAVDECLKNGGVIVRVGMAWKTEFVEHGSARFVDAGRPFHPVGGLTLAHLSHSAKAALESNSIPEMATGRRCGIRGKESSSLTCSRPSRWRSPTLMGRTGLWREVVLKPLLVDRPLISGHRLVCGKINARTRGQS